MGGVRRNCWTCGWADDPLCRLLGADRYVDGLYQWIEKTCSSDTDMPPRNADGCPGWKPKPGAENTDRAQLASLGDSATIRPDSATGWRGNLPLCRGPGSTTAARLRRAGLASLRFRR